MSEFGYVTINAGTINGTIEISLPLKYNEPTLTRENIIKQAIDLMNRAIKEMESPDANG